MTKYTDKIDDDYIEFKYNDVYNLEEMYFRSLLDYIFSCCRFSCCRLSCCRKKYSINSD